MKHLMLVLAEAIPFDTHVKMLKMAMEDYLENPSEEGKEKVLAGCGLLLTKKVAEDKGGAERLMEEFEKFKKDREIVNILNN